MSHASMLKQRRKNQKNRKLLDVAAKQGKRLAKQALEGPAVKKGKGKKVEVKEAEVKKEEVKKEKVRTER